MEEKKCIFSYFKDGVLMGHRQDTFGTIGLDWVKIYTYTPSQVETIKKNTQSELNKSGTAFMKTLLGMSGAAPMNTEGQLLDENVIITQVEKGEEEKRSWGEFELRVYESPFKEYDEFEKWKLEAFNKSLPEPLETHKFTTLKNSN